MKQSSKKNTEDLILIWDLPTRIFHWLLVAAFSAAWLSHDDNRYLYIHVFAGYLFLGLLVFRLCWGWIGSHYARFQTFAYSWPSVWAYLKGLLNGQAARYVGHNPAGSWAIFLLILVGFMVSISGVLVLGGEEKHGLFGGVLSFEAGHALRATHEYTAWIILGLVSIHVTGVIIESVLHKENLVWSMITGHKEDGSTGVSVSRYGLTGVFILALTFVFLIVFFRGYLTQTAEQPYLPFQGPALPDNALWREVCGECHLAYYPTLLPARSWEKLIMDQSEHFGEDLGLDEATLNEVRKFMVTNAAENHLTESAWKVSHLTPPDETPVQVTETVYWKEKHMDIPKHYWKHEKIIGKGNCVACHLDATQGTFEDAAMKLPKLILKK